MRARCEDEGFADFGMDEPVKIEGSLKAPGQFEHWDAEVRKLTSLGTFKGAKAEVSKTITTNFVLRHAVQLGDSPANPNAQEHYSFMAQVFNDSGVMMSTLDQNGTLEAQVIVPSLPWYKNIASKLILYFSGPNDMFWHDVEWNGDTSNAQFRWGNNVMGWQGKMAQMSYTQAVTPSVSLGAEAGLANGLTTPTSAATVRVDSADDTWFGGLKTHFQPVGAGEPGAPELSLAYHRKVVPNRVNLAASLSVVPTAMHMQSVFGAEFQLHQSTVSTVFTPSAGKVATVIQSKLSPGLNMSLSAEGIFGQQNPQTGETSDAFKFGYGLSVG